MPPPTRHALLKERHRAAIIGAARALIDERGTYGFSADDLAERADVARRTIFNHFASVEDVVVACIEVEVEAAIAVFDDAVRTAAPGLTPLDDLEGALRAADFASATATVARMFAHPERAETSARVHQQAMSHTAEKLLHRLGERYPEHSPLQLELLSTTVMSGVTVLAGAWVRQMPSLLVTGRVDAGERRAWEGLLDTFFTLLRHGFAAPGTTDAAPRGGPPNSSTTEGA